MSEQIHIALSQCLTFIKAQQLSDGSFDSASFEDVATQSDATVRHTTFYTALILSALTEVNHDDTALISLRAARFLLHERNAGGSWNYWQRNSDEQKLLPYPDDLDDTFVSLSALYKHHPSSITESMLLDSINILIQSESAVGGPYYTWLVPKPRKKQWKDIDVAVNSNVAHFLSLNEIENQTLISYIEGAIRKKKLTSAYYPSPLAIVYFISKWYQGKEKKKLIDAILKKQLPSGYWSNDIETALSVASLIRLGADIRTYRDAVLFLCHAAAEQSWMPHAFFIEQKQGKKTFYSGASAFTASVMAEALALYLNVYESHMKTVPQDAKHIAYLLDAIKTASKSRFKDCIKPMQSEAAHIIDTLLLADTHHEIALTPYFFARSFIAPMISDDTLIQLGVANTLGWAGYTIYDDVMDKEADPALLPLANIMVREVSHIFKSLLPDSTHYTMVEHILDGIDQANYWEQTFAACTVSPRGIELPRTLPSFGSYAILAQKSLGHAIGPMIICMLSGKWHARKLTEQTKQFFEQYIIAKQLHDDAHDWLEDLSRGRLTSVGVEVVHIWQREHKRPLIIENERETLQLIFWKKVIDRSSKRIINHTEQALNELDALPLNEQASYFKDRLLRLEKSARLAISERDHALQFIKAHRQSLL